MPPPLLLAPTGLPIEEVICELRSALVLTTAAVLVAEPGAGKTTVVPLRLANEAWLRGKSILVLQPRRVVARASARRLAALIGEEVGATVGYRTGEDRQVGPTTRIEVVTEGILTRRLQNDPEVTGIGLVVFDEFHERHLVSDLGLALTLDVQRSLRPDLRILVMSATVDAQGVARVLSGPDRPPAPVVISRGRLFPVEIRWRPPPAATPAIDTVARVVQAALADDCEGDVLVFLPGVAEIGRVGSALAQASKAGRGPATVDVRALHGSLPAGEQDLALAPATPGSRKVVLATDLAETSLTVDGVRIVVDAGLARRPRFDPGTGLTRLQTATASAASARQRAGRAGRTAPGVVYRLWAQGEHRARRAWPDPEITTAELTGLALELAVWGAAASSLAWLDPPSPAALGRGRSLLVELGALRPDDERAVTPLGRSMVRLGADPRLAAIIASAPPSERWLACVLAAVIDDGRPTTSGTADLAEAVRAVTAGRAIHGDRAARVFDRARRLAVRAGIRPGRIDPARAGTVVAPGYPDRLAQATGEGRLRLRGGTGLRLAPGDPLRNEAFLVIVDTGGAASFAAQAAGPGADRAIRLAAAVDEADVETIGGPAVVEEDELFWDDERDDLRARRIRRLDALVLASVVTTPVPGPATIAALVDAVTQQGLGLLGWSAGARSLQARIAFAHDHDPDAWPDGADTALAVDLETWLPPLLTRACGRAGLAKVDMTGVLRSRLGDLARRLDAVVPTAIRLASGRSVPLDYDDGLPRLRARAQDLYGTTRHPRVLDGRVPVVVEVLSPAGRPLQVTADLPGFWAGSWEPIRKEMAGRYPKHRWPSEPSPRDALRPRR